jgi:hypothetical protein
MKEVEGNNMDCICHAMIYRKNQVTSEDVESLFNKTIKKLQKPSTAVLGAVVFAMAGPKIEFALVNDYGIDGWDIRKDTEVLLSFMDPVGVVGLAGSRDGKHAVAFNTFNGHEWAQKHAKQIIKQAEHTLPLYRFVLEEDNPKRKRKVA